MKEFLKKHATQQKNMPPLVGVWKSRILDVVIIFGGCLVLSALQKLIWPEIMSTHSFSEAFKQSIPYGVSSFVNFFTLIASLAIFYGVICYAIFTISIRLLRSPILFLVLSAVIGIPFFNIHLFTTLEWIDVKPYYQIFKVFIYEIFDPWVVMAFYSIYVFVRNRCIKVQPINRG